MFQYDPELRESLVDLEQMLEEGLLGVQDADSLRRETNDEVERRSARLSLVPLFPSLSQLTLSASLGTSPCRFNTSPLFSIAPKTS